MGVHLTICHLEKVGTIIGVYHLKNEMSHIIYSIFNKITNRYYIGSTQDIHWYVRKHSHISSLNKGKHHSFKLQSSWKRHGKSAFIFQILEDNIQTKEERFKRETFWINYFNSFKNGYNCTKEATTINTTRTEEQLKRMSLSMINQYKEGKRKNPNPKGEKRDPILMAEINSRKRIPILQFDKENQFIKEWDSIKEATNYYNLSENAITNALRKGLKGIKATSKGFIWKYKNCEDIV